MTAESAHQLASAREIFLPVASLCADLENLKGNR